MNENEIGKPPKRDLPLLKNDISNILGPQKPVVYKWINKFYIHCPSSLVTNWNVKPVKNWKSIKYDFRLFTYCLFQDQNRVKPSLKKPWNRYDWFQSLWKFLPGHRPKFDHNVPILGILLILWPNSSLQYRSYRPYRVLITPINFNFLLSQCSHASSDFTGLKSL